MSAVGLFAVLYAIIEGPAKGWSDPIVVGGFVIGSPSSASFVAWELRSDHPILDVRFFANPRFSGASVAITLVFFSLFGSIFFLTQYLQFVLGYGTLQAGLAIAPVAAGADGGGARRPDPHAAVRHEGHRGGRPADRRRPRRSCCCRRRSVDSGYGIVLAVIVTLGVGMGLAMAPATDSIMGVAAQGRRPASGRR